MYAAAASHAYFLLACYIECDGEIFSCTDLEAIL